jgi:general secretion pathway protein G
MRRRRGFTLIELLLVMVIIAVLAALVLPKFTGRGEDAKIAAATTQINSLFGTALSTYEIDNGAFPSTAQGLVALRVKPTGTPEPKGWKSPYLQRDVPNDPWGNAYVYRCPGTKNPDGYDLLSIGPDAREGTEDDIGNWTKTTQ